MLLEHAELMGADIAKHLGSLLGGYLIYEYKYLRTQIMNLFAYDHARMRPGFDGQHMLVAG